MRNNKGFTLLEMMIVVAIIGILTAIAIPSYQEFVRKGYRVDAKNALQEVATRLQQNYSINKSYVCQSHVGTSVCPGDKVISTSTIAAWGLKDIPSASNKRYEISFEALTGADLATHGAYRLKAVPTNAQADDMCGVFVLSQKNIQTIIKNGESIEMSPREAEAINCWRK